MPLTKLNFTRNDLATLLQKTSQRSEVAFEQLVSDTKDALYSVSMTILRDDELARIAVLETYRCVWREAPKIDVRYTDPRKWLISVARRTSLTLASVNAATSNRLDLPIEERSALPIVLTAEYLRLHKRMEQMSKGQGSALRLSYLYGVTYQQLARATGQSVESIRAWVREGLRSVREDKKRD